MAEVARGSCNWRWMAIPRRSSGYDRNMRKINGAGYQASTARLPRGILNAGSASLRKETVTNAVPEVDEERSQGIIPLARRS
jgi:hypothetical protein